MPDSETDLDSIVLRCQKGEQTAYSELFRAIRSDIHRILIATLGPDSEIEDLIQTASLEIFRSLGRFKGESRFSTWMYRLVVNVAFQYLRKNRRRPIPVDLGDLNTELVSSDEGPERHATEKEQIMQVREILAELAPKKRIAFYLHEIEGFNPEEIARITGASKFTVKSRLFYARKEFFRKIRQRSLLEESRNVSGEDDDETDRNQ